MMILESDIEKYLIKEVKKLNGLCLKFLSGISGVPDRIILLPEGRFYFIELKRSNGKLSSLQKYQHKVFEKLGFKVVVLWSKEEVKRWIENETT